MIISRKDIAAAFVSQAEKHGNKKAITELAALILEQKMELRVDEIITDIAAEYTKRYGVLEAQVRAPFDLDAKTTADVIDRIKQQTKAKKVILHQQIDRSLLGGVVITAPDMELDLSLKTKLSKLRA